MDASPWATRAQRVEQGARLDLLEQVALGAVLDRLEEILVRFLDREDHDPDVRQSPL